MGVVLDQDVNSQAGAKDTGRILTDYFRPVFEEFNKKSERKRSADEFEISQELLQNVFEFTWAPDIFKTPRWTLMRIYNEISPLFDVTEQQSDLGDMLMYHPAETLSSKFTQCFLAIAMIDPELFQKNMDEVKRILKSHGPMLENHTREACVFILKNLKRFFEVLSGQEIVDDDDGVGLTSPENSSLEYNDLSRESKSVLLGMKSRYLKWFRARPKERFSLLQEAHKGDSANVEWVLFLAQSLRSSRREQMTYSVSRKPSNDELEYVNLSLNMEPNNPFVKLGLMECVVDAIREFNGRFHCGDIHLVDLVSAIEFLRNECEQLCSDYPKNVYFKSVVSDYFARFVPYLYFDKEYSGKLLKEVYELNPRNPKTTHRLGIFHRMNMKNMEESLKWLEKTLELDSSYFLANMDYFKMVLGRPNLYKDVGRKMTSILNDESMSAGWKLTDRVEFQFYTGLAFFASGEKEETKRHWMEAMSSSPSSEKYFTLTDVDLDSSIFKWDIKRISPEMIRVWVHEEFEKINANAGAGREMNKEDRKRNVLITRMLQLMLNIASPQKPEAYNGPYNEIFTQGLPNSVLHALIRDRQETKGSPKLVRPLGDVKGQSWRASD